MNEEMEEFIVECMDVSEIDSEYEFDVARFFDFCRPESTCEAQQAERWFLTAATYPPSPLIIKLNLVKEITAANSHGCSRLQQGKTTKLKSNNSHIPHVASQVSPSKSKIKGTISDIHTAHEICTTKPSSKARSSTLMKPTASHLAKQKFQKTSNSSDVTTSQNSLASESIATKRQKLEIGYLLKIAQLKHQRLLLSHKDTSTISNSTHPTCKVTVPREPKMETLQRAQRRIFRFNKDSEPSETKMFKSRPFNRNISKKPALPPLRKIGAPLPNYSWLSSSPHSDSAAPNALVDFKRPNNQSGVRQRKSATLLSSTSHKCNKIFPSREDNGISEDNGQESSNIMESKSIFDEKLPVHPPIELFNKLSLRSEKEARAVAHPERNPSAKIQGLKENAPNYLQLKSQKCFGKTKQCVVQRQSNTNRSLAIR